MVQKPVDLDALRAQLLSARSAARGQPAAEVRGFHSNDGKLAVPAKPAPAASATPARSSVSPFQSTQFVGDAKVPPKPQPAAGPAKAATTGSSGAKANEPVKVALASEAGLEMFAMRVTSLFGNMSERRAEIRRRFPKLDKVVVTLQLKEGRYSVVRYEPKEIGTLLDPGFKALLSVMAGDTKVRPDTYTCSFDYTLKSAFTLDAPVTGHSGLDPKATAQLLGDDAAAFAANGKAPRFMEMCNYHLLPDETGYAFILFDGKNPQKKRVYEVELAAEDELSYTFALYKVVEGKKSQMQPIVLDKAKKDVRLGFPDEGIEINFSTFKKGARCIRVDPFTEPAVAHSWGIAAGVTALGTAPGICALPELSSLVHGGPFPEFVTIGPYTVPVRQILVLSASAVLFTVATIIDVCSRKKTKKGDAK